MRLQSAFRQNKSMKTRKTNLYLALSMAIVSVAGASPAMAQSAYDAQFITYPTYNGDDLELTVDNSGTHFRLWSPKAQEARVNIYDNGRFGKPLQTLEMKADPSNGTSLSPSICSGLSSGTSLFEFSIAYPAALIPSSDAYKQISPPLI